ncbi:hypothetical protein [Lutibacter sp.]|uniref:hypothetical protein n=1 Tax=Lutibacter sp. TaxID=1925666 RepID=UPI003564833E
MKKLLFILLTILFTTSSALAQQQINRQKIKALKTSYITNALSLTPKEAEKFWPIYNLYSDKIQALKMELEGGFHRKIQLAGGLENITESQAQKFIDEIIYNEKQITENEISLINELSTVISSKKIISLKKADREFNRRILQEYSKRRRLQE